jgi:hypothetical protein
MKKLVAVTAFAVAAGAAYGQSQLDQIYAGISVGLYFPTGSTIKHDFGDSIFTLGLTPVVGGLPTSGKVTPNIEIIGADKDGSSFLLVPLTLGYQYNFGNGQRDAAVPFVRFEAGIAYYNFSVNAPGGSASGSEFGFVGDAALGVQITKTITLSAKYYLFQEEKGLNFNGLQLDLTFGVFQL